MTTNHDTEYLQLCIRLIEQKLNWRPAEEWRNYEFTELSEKILDATSVNLSATTLKRIFGKLKYESLPSSATLNALAAFLGYASWMDFKSKQPFNKQEPEKTTTTRKKFLLQHSAAKNQHIPKSCKCIARIPWSWNPCEWHVI